MAGRESDEYPHAIQAAGPVAMRVFDRVEQGLIEDGYTSDEADMLMQINLDQVLTEAQQVAMQEAQADARRTRNAQRKPNHHVHRDTRKPTTP
jgi:hypothetical protein